MAEGGYENYENPFDKYGLDKDGYDKDGYDKDGYDEYGKDRDGNIFEQGEGENIPLIRRTSTSSGRETQRPFKSRVRTSTSKEVNFPKPSYHVGDDEEEETSFMGFRESIPKINFDEELRKEVKKHYPNMDDSAVEVKMIKKRLSVRLIGIVDEKWRPILKKDGKSFIKFNSKLKKAMGPNINEILNEKKK